MSALSINPLTKIPGGYFLDILFTDGEKRRGVNTKSPYHYVMTVLAQSALEGKTIKSVRTSGGETVYENERFNEKFTSRIAKKMFF